MELIFVGIVGGVGLAILSNSTADGLVLNELPDTLPACDKSNLLKSNNDVLLEPKRLAFGGEFSSRLDCGCNRGVDRPDDDSSDFERIHLGVLPLASSFDGVDVSNVLSPRGSIGEILNSSFVDLFASDLAG